METTTSVECYVALDVDSSSRNEDDLMLFEGHGRTIIKQFGVGISQDGRNNPNRQRETKSTAPGMPVSDSMASSNGISSARVSNAGTKTAMSLRKLQKNTPEVRAQAQLTRETRGYNFILTQVGSLTIGSWSQQATASSNKRKTDETKNTEGVQSRSKRRTNAPPGRS
ncbi:hypothetical protein BEWA_003570 [Theileria equi strain WA]|uniref:Uncharacterized protein n=1 Tax=Theileria equi strain WA TaxID=1537102 RepID=L0B1G4_THEEQ|nr:hypothetical protein BEWA_003570 [Theileria equi strain WA]AFZ80949.1 hypothetical protein BEWA_003570 [Theileria equi strain WA]|eukprot:XP_004830615.1 hypothetical protein BEWA_003570 [Theileria equi strain WA]